MSKKRYYDDKSKKRPQKATKKTAPKKTAGENPCRWIILLPGQAKPRRQNSTRRTLSMVFVTAKQQQQPEHSCHLQLLFWPDIGGTMPSEDFAFTTCVDPGSPP